MKILSLFAAAVLTVGLGLVAHDAEAKRLGGGRPLGMQRQIEAPRPVTPPTAAPAPAPTNAAPAKSAAPAAGSAPARSSWMGPLAGLAAGIGLAALASHFGFGEELASLMLIILVVMAVLAVVGLVMRKRALAQQPALAGVGGMRNLAQEPVMDSGHSAASPVSAALSNEPAARGKIPADFDVAGFVRSAKVHFIRLQAANDAGNLDDIRAFTTPEMFAELKMDIAERGKVAQETDVLNVDAEVLEVVEEGDRYVASVRFVGQIREEKNGPVENVDEIWHLIKPRDGKGGWLLAGIQPRLSIGTRAGFEGEGEQVCVPATSQ
ncbi:Tim44 domain-containing protein [Sulfuricystis multivorans]|uniref:Tim44 domain-containing protein n=1 Tax=Sulfuricystis multivorans TaxID=2211108 RepID=UPI000F83CF9A|nr:Tim44-like domain-containing protein [Sulfuricystis multivorans]